jgi:hypothetical protein
MMLVGRIAMQALCAESRLKSTASGPAKMAGLRSICAGHTIDREIGGIA